MTNFSLLVLGSISLPLDWLAFLWWISTCMVFFFMNIGLAACFSYDLSSLIWLHNNSNIRKSTPSIYNHFRTLSTMSLIYVTLTNKFYKNKLFRIKRATYYNSWFHEKISKYNHFYSANFYDLFVDNQRFGLG